MEHTARKVPHLHHGRTPAALTATVQPCSRFAYNQGSHPRRSGAAAGAGELQRRGGVVTASYPGASAPATGAQAQCNAGGGGEGCSTTSSFLPPVTSCWAAQPWAWRSVIVIVIKESATDGKNKVKKKSKLKQKFGDETRTVVTRYGPQLRKEGLHLPACSAVFV